MEWFTSPWTPLAATTMAPSMLERPSLSFFRDSGISFPPCFFTWGANSLPTCPATVHSPSTETVHNIFLAQIIHSKLIASHLCWILSTKLGIYKDTSLPRNWLTFTAPPVACLATWRLLVTVGLTWAGLSSGVMCSRSLDAPLFMAFPVYSAPFTNPQLSHEAPVDIFHTVRRASQHHCFGGNNCYVLVQPKMLDRFLGLEHVSPGPSLVTPGLVIILKMPAWLMFASVYLGSSEKLWYIFKCNFFS